MDFIQEHNEENIECPKFIGKFNDVQFKSLSVDDSKKKKKNDKKSIPANDRPLITSYGTKSIVHLFKNKGNESSEQYQRDLVNYEDEKQRKKDMKQELDIKNGNRKRFTKRMMKRYNTRKRAVDQNEKLDHFFEPSKKKQCLDESHDVDVDKFLDSEDSDLE